MFTTTLDRFGVLLASVSCCLFLAACGAERGDVSADGSTGTPITTETVDGLSQDETATQATGEAASTTDTTAPTASIEPPPTADPALTLTTIIGEASDTAAAADAETTAAVPPSSEATTTSTATSTTSTAAAAAPVESSVPALEVVGGEQSVADRIPPGQTWSPFATFGEVTLVHPSIRVERIGFHESNHDGARQLEPTAGAVAPIVLESRQRDTGSRTAADIVVEPGTEIRAPVTGTVLRAGGYVLYCDHQDDFLVIEPDSQPGWEVKLLHINGVMVSAGDRVEAGVTVVAPEATVLPFDSQVDEFTATPPWPHVHIELVDPSIPDRPSTGGGC